MAIPTELDDQDPNKPARCPRTLPGGHARCRALVLVRDAYEHGRWHDDLDAALTAPVDVTSSLEVDEWPEPAVEAIERTVGPGGL